MTDENESYEEMMVIAESIAAHLAENEHDAYQAFFALLVIAAGIVADLGPSTQRSAPKRFKNLIKNAVKFKETNIVRAI